MPGGWLELLLLEDLGVGGDGEEFRKVGEAMSLRIRSAARW
jgi:hypothetical protein